MPSALHQSLLELLRERPSFAVELVRRLTDLELPEHDDATLTTDSLAPSEIGPLHPDAVILLSRRRAERDDVTVGVLVGEVQLKVRKDKIAAWSLHVPLAARIFGAPAYLLVVTPYEGVAEWVENLPAFGSVRLVPIVLGPSRIPRIVDDDEARRSPELAVLSALTHGRDDDPSAVLMPTLRAVADLPVERAEHLLDMLASQFGDVLPALLETIMPTARRMPISEMFRRPYLAGRDEGLQEGLKQGHEEGRQEGREQGLTAAKAESILAILEARGFVLDNVGRARVTTCRERAQLDAWIRRAVVITSADELFES